MSIAEINALDTAYQNALSAAESADSVAAWGAAITAKMKLISAISKSPDVSRSLGDGGNQSIRWAVREHNSELNYLRERRREAQRNASFSGGPLQQTPVTYQRPNSSGDFS